MSDISIIEWIVYGLFGYGTLMMTVITLIKDVPQTRNLALTRVFFTIPGLICNGVLAGSGVHIVFFTTNTITKNLNTTQVWSEATTNVLTLQSPVWIMVHVMFFMTLFWFIVTQVMFILKDPNAD